MRKVLTEKFIASLKPAERDRYYVHDAIVPGMSICVTQRGHKSYVLGTRYPKFARRSLGTYGAISLAAAREKARSWLLLVKEGRDPKREREKARRADDNTFGVIAEEFIKRKLPGQRKGWRTEREIRRELLPTWDARPITDITRRDVVELIEKIVDRPAPAYARNVLGHVKVIYSWAIARGLYGIEHAPTDHLRSVEILGQRKPRTRVLNDDEIRAVWKACETIGYPFGPAAKLLLLTGARSSEISHASIGEIDPRRRALTVPAERYKTGQEHTIPLSDEAWRIIETLPRWSSGYLFSLKGQRPLCGWYWAKLKLDELSGVTGWTVHDLRRTMRTNLSALRVPDHIAELAIGHSKVGLRRVYDQHRFEDEIREALDAWSARLKMILDPGSNVIHRRFR